MMVTADYSFQNIDWWHGQISENEPFDHVGDLQTSMLNLRFSVGFNDYWDMTIEQPLIYRGMGWHVDYDSEHHRSECSDTDFFDRDGALQAKGGLFGDTQFKFRYLFTNTGKGLGNRFFIETGVFIPSNNSLRKDPFHLEEKANGTYDESENHSHRHFAVSDGAYKISLGLEYFKKRESYPVFWGFTSKIIYPLHENKYGYLPSVNYDLTFSMLSGPPRPLNMKSNSFQLASIGLGLNIKYSDIAKWNGFDVPNSKSNAITPMLTFVFSSQNSGSLGFSINYSDLSVLSVGDDAPSGGTDVWGFSFSYRKILDKRIEKLYWN